VRPTIDFLEALTLLTYVAALTTRVQLGTSVLALPMRQPVLHAKIMASLDHLSTGRFILGSGVGWWQEEFKVLGVPWQRRGKRMDEYLQLLRALWRDEWVNFEGEFYRCVDWTCNPKPVNGTIPILLGGESEAQLDRVGRLADGWHATWANLPTLRELFAVAQAAATRAGRDPNALSLTIEGGGLLGADGMADLATSLHELAALGVSHAILTVNPREVAKAESLLRGFGATHLTAIQAA